MKVLQLHTEYRGHGGENVVVDREAAELAEAGHDVVRHVVSNEGGTADTVGSLLVAPWNPRAARSVVGTIDRERPDVVHVHNTWFRLSPASIVAASRAGVPVVHTLHNTRWLCVNGQMIRDGRQCRDCVTGTRWSAIQHRCYRSSRPLSIVAAATGEVAERTGTWTRHIDRFIALTPRARSQYETWGFPGDRIVVRPHRIADPGPRTREAAGSGTVLYVGRISGPKGVADLCREWSSRQRPGDLVVIGDGPLRGQLEAAHPDISFLGHVPFEDVVDHMLRARALVVPSRAQESFGLVVAEAMAAGLPVALSDAAMIGDFVQQVDVAWTFAPTSADEWGRIFRLIDDDAAVESGAHRARSVYEEHFAPDGARSLIDVYRQAIERRA